jgi:hypothetical protein
MRWPTSHSQFQVKLLALCIVTLLWPPPQTSSWQSLQKGERNINKKPHADYLQEHGLWKNLCAPPEWSMS